MRNGDWVPASGQLNENLSEHLRMLRRRMSTIALTVAIVMTGVIAFIFLAPPRYTASSQIVFDSKAAMNSSDLRPVLTGQPPDEAFILSELDVIRSRSLAGRVIRELHLDENPDFDESLRPALFPPPSPPPLPVPGDARPDGFFSGLIKRHLPEKWLLAWQRKPLDPEVHKERLVDKFQRSVEVTRNNRSRTVNISFTASTPQLAADALNTLTEFYLVARMEDRLENAKRASAWLTEQIQDLRDKAQQADKAVEDYRASHNLFETSRETLISKQIGELTSRLTDAGIERQAAEANLIQVRRLLKGDGLIDSTPQVMQSDLIRKYREDELALERREAQMTQEYGEQHPVLIQLRAEKRRLEDKIRTEISRVALSLENQAKMARDREDSIQASLQHLKSTMAEANTAAVGLRALERQADASKVLLERMMGALLQTSAEENAKSQTPDARLISSAPVPERPSFPPKLLLLVGGLLGSTFLGVLLGFVLEHLDSGFRSAEQVEAACGLPVLAQVPLLPNRKVRLAAYVLDQPSSAYAAAIHAIYTRISLMSAPQPPKVVLFTSAEPREGKSMISLSVARQQALSRRRVALVEVDLHRPSIARMAGVSPAPGLTEVLAGMASVASVIQRDTASGAHIIVVGGQGTTHSGKPIADVGPVLEQIRELYDVVVLDAPPVLGLADTNIFAALADATFMVVRWGATRRQVFKYAIGDITKFGGRIDGVILSQVDTRRQAYYGYGDSRAYTGEAAQAHIG